MKRLIFWWQRRRAGFPVKLGSRPSGVRCYSAFVLLADGRQLEISAESGSSLDAHIYVRPAQVAA